MGRALLGADDKRRNNFPEPVGVFIRDPQFSPSLTASSTGYLEGSGCLLVAAGGRAVDVRMRSRGGGRRGRGEGLHPGDPGARALMAPLVAGREAH